MTYAEATNMSTDAGITLRLVCSNGPVTILDALLASEWAGHTDGWWCIPLHEDPSDWSLIGHSEKPQLVALFHAKMVTQQVFGIRLWWQGGPVGGEFLVFPNCEVTFSPSMDRVILHGRTSDVSWYLARLLPPFEQGRGLVVESWIWQETS